MINHILGITNIAISHSKKHKLPDTHHPGVTEMVYLLSASNVRSAVCRRSVSSGKEM